jgi:hypothetical protein
MNITIEIPIYDFQIWAVYHKPKPVISKLDRRHIIRELLFRKSLIRNADKIASNIGVCTDVANIIISYLCGSSKANNKDSMYDLCIVKLPWNENNLGSRHNYPDEYYILRSSQLKKGLPYGIKLLSSLKLSNQDYMIVNKSHHIRILDDINGLPNINFNVINI